MRTALACSCFSLMVIVAWTSTPAMADLTKHYAESLFRTTDNGHFGVELLIHDGEFRTGTNRADVIVHDALDRDVAGAEISITPWMPEMGHGVSERARVTERGGGLYTVENVVFSMAGRWELRITVAAGGHDDAVTFDLPGIGREEHKGQADDSHGEHGSAKEAVGENTEPGAAVPSADGRFIVTYGTEPDRIPLNRIHRWTVAVTTPAGKPVRGAHIRVEGNMPAHGHGLPTDPEVTDELEGGRYVIEGMKFNMPGLWLITLHISSEEGEDHAVLKLQLR